MKAYEYEAVIYEGEVYCVGCLPAGVDPESEDVTPIFPGDEWDSPPECIHCGEAHDYMSVDGDREDEGDEDEDPDEDEDEDEDIDELDYEGGE